MKPNYLIIPAAIVSVAMLGSAITRNGMAWYRSIELPSWTPPGSVIGAVWTILFLLSAVSLLLVFNGRHASPVPGSVGWVATLNGALNVLWSLVFFGFHWLGVATVEAAILGGTVVWLMVLVWPLSRIAALLLAPYAAWVAFATYLAFSVWRLNA